MSCLGGWATPDFFAQSVEIKSLTQRSLLGSNRIDVPIDNIQPLEI